MLRLCLRYLTRSFYCFAASLSSQAQFFQKESGKGINNLQIWTTAYNFVQWTIKRK